MVADDVQEDRKTRLRERREEAARELSNDHKEAKVTYYYFIYCYHGRKR